MHQRVDRTADPPGNLPKNLHMRTAKNRLYGAMVMLCLVIGSVGCDKTTDLATKTDSASRLNPGMSAGQRAALAEKKHDNGERGY
jgi:hypothetical protein